MEDQNRRLVGSLTVVYFPHQCCFYYSPTVFCFDFIVSLTAVIILLFVATALFPFVSVWILHYISFFTYFFLYALLERLLQTTSLPSQGRDKAAYAPPSLRLHLWDYTRYVCS